jgi:hypothetical protein
VVKNLGHRRGFANQSLQNSAISRTGEISGSKNREQQRQTTTIRVDSAVPQNLWPNCFLRSVRVLYQMDKIFQIVITRDV